MTIVINTAVTTTPDFGGFRFYVEAGRTFDLADYCEAYNINEGEVAEQGHGGYKAVQEQAACLCPGEWLEVTHEVEND